MSKHTSGGVGGGVCVQREGLSEQRNWQIDRSVSD